MKNNFFISIETMHCPDGGNQDNVHELPSDQLKHRDVAVIDIANDPVMSKVSYLFCPSFSLYLLFLYSSHFIQ